MEMWKAGGMGKAGGRGMQGAKKAGAVDSKHYCSTVYERCVTAADSSSERRHEQSVKKKKNTHELTKKTP